MENRSLPVVAGLIAGLALVSGAFAADREADWQARLERSAALKAEAKTRQSEADRQFGAQSERCREKFLVNNCRNDARRTHVEATRENRRLENEGSRIEREVQKEQAAARAAQREADAPRRAAELQRREQETAAARQEEAGRIATAQARKEQQAVAGERRKEAAAEAHRRKVAAHEARVAEQREKAERRAARNDGKP